MTAYQRLTNISNTALRARNSSIGVMNAAQVKNALADVRRIEQEAKAARAELMGALARAKAADQQAAQDRAITQRSMERRGEWFAVAVEVAHG